MIVPDRDQNHVIEDVIRVRMMPQKVHLDQRKKRKRNIKMMMERKRIEKEG